MAFYGNVGLINSNGTQMSRSQVALALLALTLLVGFVGPALSGPSCCQCSLGGQHSEDSQGIRCECSDRFPEFCEFPEASKGVEGKMHWKIVEGDYLKNYTDMEYLMVSNASMANVVDIIKEQKSLKRLKLSAMEIDFDSNFDYNWSEMLENLTNLTELSIEGSAIMTISSQLFANSKIFSPKDRLIIFSATNCGIRSIKDNIMNEWTNLKMISLANNCIRNLNRNWFAANLSKLWSLDLSYNSIDSIPDNFFTGMTALRKLRLDNNSFKTLKSSWFLPNTTFWSGLHEFWIDGNMIECNPDLEWIPEVSHPTFFDEGNCNSTVIGRMRYFYDLAKYDSDITDMTDDEFA